MQVTTQMKDDAWKDILYEMRMIEDLTKLKAICPPEQTRVLHDAVLESFLIHVRNLVEFLGSLGGGAKYMKASDFTSDAIAMPVEMRRLLGPISERLAHLSWERTAPQLAWKIPEIARAVLGISNRFLESAGRPERFFAPD